MISDYLRVLGDTLAFDRALSRRVVQEIDDHLCEAIAADTAHDRLEAERRAIANFGEPHVLAAQFAVLSLARQTKLIGVAVVAAIVGVLATMKARVAWYALVQWTLSEDVRPLGRVVLSVDRFAFWLAVCIGLAGLVYVGRHRIPAVFHRGYRKQIRRAFLLCGCAMAALVVSVISDGVLTALQVGTELCLSSAVPIASMAVEIACAGTVIFLIVKTLRRAAATEALLKIT